MVYGLTCEMHVWSVGGHITWKVPVGLKYRLTHKVYLITELRYILFIDGQFFTHWEDNAFDMLTPYPNLRFDVVCVTGTLTYIVLNIFHGASLPSGLIICISSRVPPLR